MSDVSTLINRIDAEFSKLDERIKHARQLHLSEHQARQERLAAFEKLLPELPAIWKPRLEAFIQRFGDRVKVTADLSSTRRSALLEFKSELAQIKLRLTASTDHDVEQLFLDYRLDILPILMKFDAQKKAEWPLNAIDEKAIGAWIDDCLVDFVKTYLELHQNHYYLKDHLVEDPVAKIKFPKFAAYGDLNWEGKTYYFIGEETQREFAVEHGIACD